MIIQVWHTRNSDFQKELYDPIKNAYFFHDYTWIIPHDWTEIISSKETLKTIDLFIAEVSFHATGLGIELGFSSAYEKRILCIYKKWSKISSSLKFVTQDFIEYENTEDMIEKVWNFLKNL